MNREQVEACTIIRAPIGSTVHGLHLEGTDDRDEMGVCIEPAHRVIGFNEFEQFIYRSATEREGKHDAPSQPGDLDLTIYSLRKWLRLALGGNPTIINLLFVPPEQLIQSSFMGSELQALAPCIVSRVAGNRYLGYLESQRRKLVGERGQKRVKRPLLEEKYGFDTKYAMHMLRLGHQGVELLLTGKISLPMKEPVRQHIRDVREGKVPLNDILQETGDLERQLKDLIDTSWLQPEPQLKRVEDWMIEVYLADW
jgi:hypothetical protein